MRALALYLLEDGGAASVAQLTPRQFMETLFDLGCLLTAPSLLELQLRWADG